MVDKYIKEILVEHGKVYIPKLGLISKITNSEHSSDASIIAKPSFYYSIDSNYTNEEDTWLIYAVARGEHVSLEDAERQIQDRVEEIKMFLEEGESVEIEGVGTLFNSSGNVEFVKESSIDEIEEESFGIPSYIQVQEEPSINEPVSDSPSEDSTTDNSYEERADEERAESFSEDKANNDQRVEEQTVYFDEIPEYEQEQKKSKTGLIVVILIFVLIGVGLSYYFLRPQAQETNALTSIGSADSYEEPEEGPLDTASGYDSEENTIEESPVSSVSKPLPIKEEGKRYYIIAGAFSINENAEKYKRALGANGLKVKVLKAKETEGLYRVSLADFEEFQEALAQAETLKKQYGNSLWILKY